MRKAGLENSTFIGHTDGKKNREQTINNLLNECVNGW